MAKKKVKPLSTYISRSLKQYFRDLNGTDPTDLHRELIAEVEKPMLVYVMKHTDGNISRASKILGITRGTLRKKITLYHITTT